MRCRLPEWGWNGELRTQPAPGRTRLGPAGLGCRNAHDRPAWGMGSPAGSSRCRERAQRVRREHWADTPLLGCNGAASRSAARLGPETPAPRAEGGGRAAEPSLLASFWRRRPRPRTHRSAGRGVKPTGPGGQGARMGKISPGTAALGSAELLYGVVNGPVCAGAVGGRGGKWAARRGSPDPPLGGARVPETSPGARSAPRVSLDLVGPRSRLQPHG